MKSHLLSLTAASVLIAVSVTHSRSDGWPANPARTVSSIRPAALLERGSIALTAYVNACADGDSSLLQAVLTDDAVIELPFIGPGTFLLVNDSGAAEFCNTSGTPGHLSSLQMYPAGGHAMFASFIQHGDKPLVVLIEMHGSRISLLRDFTADSEQVKRYAAILTRHASKEPS